MVALTYYRTAVQTGGSIVWRCATCMSESSAVPVAESTPVDFAEPVSDNESTVYEPVAAVPSALDESSIHDPPAALEGNDSSFAVTFQLLQH